MPTLERHPLIPPRKVDPQQALPAMEEEVMRRWRERDVFAQSLRIRADAESWVFYEGPPTANGRPGSHHVLSRVFKDIYPRYKTMRGYRVERKGGWDCHGLPVEIAVEQQLGISSKAEIEDYGIERFNAKCRESVFTYLEEWNRLTERIGFWIDLDGAYRTLDESYIESVWWALAAIDREGLLYEGHKVVPYCTRCGTALSSHEVALGYKDVVDPSVYVRLPLRVPAARREEPVGANAARDCGSGARGPSESPLRAGDALLVWTTTPWTLPGNVAVAVGPAIEYVRAEYRGETLILAAALVEQVLGQEAEILDRFPGSALLELSYEGPIFATGEPAAFPIVAGDFVTTADGTGLVHLAPAFGEDDFDAARANGLFDPTEPRTLFNPVRRDGTYDERVRSRDGGSYAGRYVKDPALSEELIADLERHGLLFRASAYEHSYPHCWRCGTPLIYYAKASWYIRTTAVRERMLAANETVAWHPPHIKHGRFGDWLQNNVDWALSRERYWGTPLPVWRCADGHVHTIGSFAELQERSGQSLADHHRPYVDEIEFPCPHADRANLAADADREEGQSCGRPMRRVPEVIDVWFDSGAMPFAQHHAPFEHEQGFRERFPADFVCEALDQTRGWFYSLLAVSTLLFDTAPYRNVVCLGLILDASGQKMSKSKGNTVEPWQVIEDYGADAFRWYFFTSKQPWDGYRFSREAIGDGVRLFLKQLWSTYFFYVLYAHANEEALSAVACRSSPAADAGSPDADLDRWARSRTASTVRLVTAHLDAYDATAAGRAIAELVDELSNWYVRRSRRRFWDGDPRAFQTLHWCLVTIAKLLAPFCPFAADEIYDNLDGTLASVHLCDFPTAEESDAELERAMAIARETVRLGLRARGQAKIKVRQPLHEAVVVASGREREAIERLMEVVRDELNVREVRFVTDTRELGHYEVKPNYRRLGPLFGKDMPLVAEAIAALDPALVAAATRDGEGHETEPGGSDGPGDAPRGSSATLLGISIAGREHMLAPEDVILTLRAPEGYSVEREGAHAVALDLAIDDDLRRDGLAREIVHAVQSARKNAGLAIEDRIELRLCGDAALIEAAVEHSGRLTGELLARELSFEDGGDVAAMHREQVSIDGMSLGIALRRAARS
ncbi:MAG TPA: isoleucine--tRNA ligase [Solirubrobacteraceae bacterium]|nr:isoleucine--tRNA ligase [Solirubrobacteraceae bacterium]